MPAVARPRATLAQPSRDRGAEFQHPAPYGLVGDLKPALGQQFLDIAVAQGEAEIEPDRVLDHLGREPMTAVAERTHTDILPDTRSPNPVSVTMPGELQPSVLRGTFRFLSRERLSVTGFQITPHCGTTQRIITTNNT